MLGGALEPRRGRGEHTAKGRAEKKPEKQNSRPPRPRPLTMLAARAPRPVVSALAIAMIATVDGFAGNLAPIGSIRRLVPLRAAASTGPHRTARLRMQVETTS